MFQHLVCVLLIVNLSTYIDCLSFKTSNAIQGSFTSLSTPNAFATAESYDMCTFANGNGCLLMWVLNATVPNQSFYMRLPQVGEDPAFGINLVGRSGSIVYRDQNIQKQTIPFPTGTTFTTNSIFTIILFASKVNYYIDSSLIQSLGYYKEYGYADSVVSTFDTLVYSSTLSTIPYINMLTIASYPAVIPLPIPTNSPPPTSVSTTTITPTTPSVITQQQTTRFVNATSENAPGKLTKAAVAGIAVGAAAVFVVIAGVIYVIVIQMTAAGAIASAIEIAPLVAVALV